MQILYQASSDSMLIIAVMHLHRHHESLRGQGFRSRLNWTNDRTEDVVNPSLDMVLEPIAGFGVWFLANHPHI